MFLIIFLGICSFFAILALLSPLIAPKSLSLRNAHVLITGGSSGIGKAVAKYVLLQGGSVTLIARNESKLSAAKSELAGLCKGVSKIHCISVDVSNKYEDVENAVKEAETEIQPVDILVNCAGFSVAGKFQEMQVADFKRLMEVNYYGVVHCTKAVINGMMERQRGRIVVLSSQAGQLGLFGFTGYSAAKFALRGFAESLQMEVKPYNIHVTVAFPPDVDTPGLHEENKTKPEETKLLSEQAGLFEADYVAKKIMDDSARGKFLCSIGLDGFLLSVLTCGMTPVISIIDATLQVVLLGLFRAIGLIYVDSFDRIIKRCKIDREQKLKQT